MELGPTEELFTDPANPYTHSLLSAIPEPDPTSEKQRITLYGTPPNPRYPPDGCPFSTRCPTRIRPPEYEDLSDDLWGSLNTLEEVLRERKRAERSITDRVRGMLGLDTRFGTIDEIYEEQFGDMQVPSRVEPILDEAADHVRSGDEGKALDVLKAEFGGACEKQMPEYYTVSDTGRRSFCHRHDPEYRSPEQTLEDRH